MFFLEITHPLHRTACTAAHDGASEAVIAAPMGRLDQSDRYRMTLRSRGVRQLRVSGTCVCVEWMLVRSDEQTCLAHSRSGHLNVVRVTPSFRVNATIANLRGS